MTKMGVCDICGDEFPVSELTKTEDGLECKDCAAIIASCGDCGCAVREDGTEVYDEETDAFYCEDCATERGLI